MNDRAAREQLAEMLAGRGAHMSLAEAVADFPSEQMNELPPNVPYTPWQLLEHIRLTQRDILDYVRDPAGYRDRRWPDDYWPDREAETDVDGWEATLAGYADDLAALRAIVLDPSIDPTAPLPHTPGHTVMREARLVADHTAYHVGEFAILRQVMGTWPPGHE